MSLQPIQTNTPIADATGRPTQSFLFFINQLLNVLSSSTSTLAQQAFDLATTLLHRNINTTGGLQGGGDLETDLTLSLTDTAVTPGTYGDSTHVGQFTVDQKGRITAATNVAVSGGGGGGLPAGYENIPRLSIFANSNAATPGFYLGRGLICPYDLNITAVSAFMRSAQAGVSVIPAIYSADPVTGAPQTLLATGPSAVGTSQGTNDWPLTTPIAVSKGTAIWVGIINDPSTVLLFANTQEQEDSAFFACVGAPPSTAPSATLGTTPTGWCGFFIRHA